ncbi:MAG: precorrin-3B synthase [Beijerinckiaceae bacterium]
MTRSHSLRRGWCPGALRPMPTGDGLLVRVRLRGGRLPVSLARQLAEGARRFGNGLIDLSARANLQMRGITEETHAALLAHLADADILDKDPNAEAVRNIVASPLAGSRQFGALLDLTPIHAALDARLASDARLHALPGKFSFLLDDGGWPSLADVNADVRFAAYVDDGMNDGLPVFRVALGGTAESAVLVGGCALHEVEDVAVRVALRFLAAKDEGGGIAFRMRDLLGECSNFADSIELPGKTPPPAITLRQQSPIGVFTGARGQSLLGLGVAFGRLTADALDLIAAAAEALDCDAVRLAPWRVLLLPLGKTETLASWLERFAAMGFILDPDDPRRAIAACPGAPACRNATTPTQDDAMRLAPLARYLSDHGIGLHVSGCVKGCAHPQHAPVTLVAASGLYSLVIDGTAQDATAGAPFPIEAAAAVLQNFIAARSP